MCSFWLADVYVLLGRQQEAQALYERLVGLCNDVGLLAEQYDPVGKRMLGNFPQAFSHIGIINTALNLHRAQCPVRDRAEFSDASVTPVEAGSTAMGARSAQIAGGAPWGYQSCV